MIDPLYELLYLNCTPSRSDCFQSEASPAGASGSTGAVRASRAGESFGFGCVK